MQEVSRDKKKRTRISNNKSKSGCLTCKGRRVKCDERQPSCLRCEKGNYRCEGFGIKSNVRLSERAIIPRIAANFQPILYQPQQTLFLSDRESQYFRLFCDQMVPQLTGHFESDLWSRLVLQTCDIDVSIRNAIIALAALISTSEVLYSTSSTDLVKSFDAHEHHQFAIRQYSKAIHAMRKAAVSGKQDLRTTLITSLVIVCFETFHGNHDSAAKQVVIGLDLIDSQALAKEEKKSSVPSIEEELTQIFERLDIQAMTFIDPRPGFRHKALTHIGQSRIDAMPKTLESMEEARNYLELIMRRCLHFMASLLPGTLPTGLLQVDIIGCLPDEYVEGRDQHLDELRQWHFAFNPLLRNAQSPGGSKDFLRATSLELQYLSCFFILAIIPTTSQGTPDSRSFMPLFQQIVAGAEAILSHPSEAFSKSTYVFEIQVVCPLYAVAVCCPQRTLRRKAIRLLLDKPRRECLWDSSMVGKLAEWIVGIEEEAFEGEYAPEDVRTTCVDVLSFDMKTKEARVSCLAVDKESREWTKREAVVFW